MTNDISTSGLSVTSGDGSQNPGVTAVAEEKTRVADLKIAVALREPQPHTHPFLWK